MERGVGFQAKKKKKNVSNIISETAHNYFLWLTLKSWEVP